MGISDWRECLWTNIDLVIVNRHNYSLDTQHVLMQERIMRQYLEEYTYKNTEY